MKQVTLPTVVFAACVFVVLAVVGQGGARSAETVTCSSTTPPRDSLGRPIDLTATWFSNDRQPYYLRQIGSCLWWAGSKGRTNVFFGMVSGSAVTGVWTDVKPASTSTRTTGTLTLFMTSRNTVLVRRTSIAAGAFPAKYLRKST